MIDVIIYGAGGLGRLVLDTLLQSDLYRPVAFLDSDRAKHGDSVDGLTILGGLEKLADLRAAGVTSAIVAVGDNRTRIDIARRLLREDFTLASAIHPSTSIAPSAFLGAHLIIGSRVMISVHASIADHCVLLAGAIVEHDNTLGSGAFLHSAVRLAGGVEIGALATLHIGACVIPYRKVGRQARVEAGAVVISDVLPGSAAAGAPAVRVDRERSHFVPDDELAVPKPAPRACLHQIALVNQATK